MTYLIFQAVPNLQSLSLLNEKKKDIYDYFKLEIMALTHNLYIYRFLQPVRFLKKEIFC
ncbi:hypothetical protein IMSAGC022_00339 [Alistipes sp.]|nr:hypothetical protein IMSAGC022_00339 [Alistipes sp.]